MANAVADSISQFLPLANVKIKWPNDILVNKKKVAGILMESQISGNQISNVVVGIGVNINQTNLPEATFSATSILLETEKETDLEFFTQILSEHLEVRYLQTKVGNYSKIDADYQNRLFGKNQMMNFELKGALKEGIVLEVDVNGQLVMEVAGELKRFSNGEIKLVV